MSCRPEFRRVSLFSTCIVLTTMILLARPCTTLADTGNATQIYLSAIKSISLLKRPPFYQFGYALRQSLGSTERSESWSVTERTTDGIALFVSGSVRKHRELLVRPDLFLTNESKPPAVPTSEVSTNSLRIANEDPVAEIKVIGKVTATSSRYAITRLPDEDIPGCSSVAVLSLAPYSKPELYNLRKLWIDQSANRICRATAVWSNIAEINGKSLTISVILDLNMDGLVESWRTSGEARSGLFRARFFGEARYSSFAKIDDEPLDWST